ncbi:MAG: hypothetical protein M0R06_01480 [Sphaerochaeta sp.]|jgi:hypothetical protein|nr:hypothetical protein [Sphaerochaeta sp.]
MPGQFLQELENHWKLLSAIGLYTLFLIRFAFNIGAKAKGMITDERLTKHCDDKMESCRVSLLPTVESAKTDHLILHDLENFIKKIEEDMKTSKESREAIDRCTRLIWRHTIKLRSQVANTQIILGYMVDKLWSVDDPEFKKLVGDIFNKDQEEVTDE